MKKQHKTQPLSDSEILVQRMIEREQESARTIQSSLHKLSKSFFDCIDDILINNNKKDNL
jgi:hypothetical protein